MAILFDWESNWALKRGEDSAVQRDVTPKRCKSIIRYFWEQDIPVDILTPEQDFSDYPLVVAPMLIYDDRKTMLKLTSYVEKGGILVSSYFTGMVNETDLFYIGGLPQPLKALFGIEGIRA